MADTLTRSRDFAARHPDFNEALYRARDDGHTLANESVEHLKRIDRLDVGYYLSLPENRSERDKVHNLTRKPTAQIAELDRIASRLDRHGFGVDYEPKTDDTERYLERRKQDIRAGKRRR